MSSNFLSMKFVAAPLQKAEHANDLLEPIEQNLLFAPPGEIGQKDLRQLAKAVFLLAHRRVSSSNLECFSRAQRAICYLPQRSPTAAFLNSTAE